MLSLAVALPSRRDERRARSREAILSTARELIAAGGLAATSTQKVALAAGLSHGALFVHFPRREDLLAALVGGLAAHFEAGLGPPPSSLATELALQLERLAAQEKLYARLLAEETALPASARESLRALERVLSARVAAAFAADRPRLGLRPLSPRLVAAAWLAMLQRALLRGETGAALPEWGGEIRRFLLELVAA
ncbi:TetR/AcrR family transcriptional regulator [bacterium]|nr:TetR/AcrR family transcriptional regulator [bacterium]